MNEVLYKGVKDLGSLAVITSIAFLLKELAFSAWVEKVPGKFTRGTLRKGQPPGSTSLWNQSIEDEVIKEKNFGHLIDKEKHLGTMEQYAKEINEATKAKMSHAS